MTNWTTTTQILNDLQQRSDSAWDQFCQTFSPAIVAFGRQQGLRQEEAEDAAQDTLIAFLKAVQEGRYDSQQGRLSSWLFGFAHRVILKTQRQRARHLGVTSPSEQLEQQPDDQALHLTWETQWKRVVLSRCLERVVLSRCLERVRHESDPQVFAAFTQYALQDQSADEVAQRLGISRNAVYIAKCRILTRLRELESQLQDIDRETLS